MRTTDMADELFSGAAQPLPAGVRLATARHGGVTVTRVEIAREGLSRPRGRYVTLEMPSGSVLVKSLCGSVKYPVTVALKCTIKMQISAAARTKSR